MSSGDWKLENDLCRCCHAEGSFKNLAEPFISLGQEEVYSDMLQECLNIDLTPVPGPLCAVTYTICEVCVSRLRDAANFKKQVLDCEQRFRDMYAKNFIKSADSKYETDIKVEVDDSSEDLKEEYSQMSDDEDDDDFGAKIIEDGESKTDTEEDSSKLKTKKLKLKPKPKSKTRKPQKPRKTAKSNKLNKEVNPTEKAVEGDKKGIKAPIAPRFHLRDDDYTKDGDVYLCSRCDKRYDKFLSLRFHVKTKHYKIPRFRCPYCQKEFMTQAPLTVHKLEVHNIDERFNCKACKGIFNTKLQLKKHVNNFHMLGEKHKCEFCEYESFSFESLYKHKFRHKTVKDFHCRFCRKSFLRKTTLDLHERIHTGDRRKVCKVCGQAFVQKASLNYHMTKYHPEVNF